MPRPNLEAAVRVARLWRPFMDAEPEEQPVAEAVKTPRKRLHHLDWLRLLMVMGVVYAHTVKSGINGGSAFNQAWRVDDHTLYDHADYADMYQRQMELNTSTGVAGPVSGQCVPAVSHPSAHQHPTSKSQGRSPLSVRWIAVVRQWCLPLLFWVSGAAVACSYRGGMPRGLLKLAGFTFIGMSLNAVLWLLGPLDDSCYLGNPDCYGKGILFSFTIVPWAGCAFAVMFQMWYTVVLMVLSLVNWPTFAVAYGTASKPWMLFVQWSIDMAVYCFFVVMSGDECPRPRLLLVLIATLEFAFLALVGIAAPNMEGCSLPRWLPLRAVHYVLALVSVAQFGALPYGRQMANIGFSYVLYLCTGFNRFFNMGFLLTSAQLNPSGDQAEPLMSRYWPLALVLFTAVAPSTNWDLAGMLTYPYYVDVIDRVLYIAGAMALTFLMDRCSRGMRCDALPRCFSQTSIILYLFHPVIITVFLHFGVHSVPLVWLVNVLIALAIALALRIPAALAAKVADSASSDEE